LLLVPAGDPAAAPSVGPRPAPGRLRLGQPVGL
ncbi:MAG: hypothetical protein QOC64_2591, partial [Solirubrobacteraceae bacterium]|nr:hypothetical protein [Solirubrobacteraceae bacterium]